MKNYDSFSRVFEIANQLLTCHSLYLAPCIEEERQRGRVVRAADLKSGDPEFKFKSGDPEFKSRSEYYLDLFEVVLGSTPRLRLYIFASASWDS